MAVLSPFKEGAVIQIAQGVLRGVGPMGPRGYVGPAGPQGIPGPAGPQPEMDPVSAHFSKTGTVDILASGALVTLPMSVTEYDVGDAGELLGNGSVRLHAKHANGIAYVMTPTVVTRPGQSGSGSYRIEIGVFTEGAATPLFSSIFEHTNGTLPSTFTYTGQQLIFQDVTVLVRVKVYGATVNPQVTFVSLKVTAGSGPDGPPGPEGPTGPVGGPGPQGPAGNANSGFATMDGMMPLGGDADALPTGSLANSQGLLYPTGGMTPAVPAYLKNLADSATKKIVRVFASGSAEDAAPDRAVGQISFLQSNNSLRLNTTNGSVIVPTTVAQVAYGTTEPPAGNYPAGMIYFKVV